MTFLHTICLLYFSVGFASFFGSTDGTATVSTLSSSNNTPVGELVIFGAISDVSVFNLERKDGPIVP